MTRLQAGILALLARGPHTVLDLAIALDERTDSIRKEMRRLETLGVAEHTLDGWKLTDKAAA